VITNDHLGYNTQSALLLNSSNLKNYLSDMRTYGYNIHIHLKALFGKNNSILFETKSTYLGLFIE
jgi:hypothetical protein